MVALDHTRALIASLAAVIGLPELPQDETGGYHLTIGGDGDVFIYGGDDISILVVVPVARLPEAPGYAVVNELLHGNMFNSDYMPFVAAVDDGGMVILWGKLTIADFDGTTLARAIDNLADRAAKLRGDMGTE